MTRSSWLPAERQRLTDQRERGTPWWRWGPYLSERQCGTVREDYSAYGSAWDSFPRRRFSGRVSDWLGPAVDAVAVRHRYLAPPGVRLSQGWRRPACRVRRRRA